MATSVVSARTASTSESTYTDQRSFTHSTTDEVTRAPTSTMTINSNLSFEDESAIRSSSTASVQNISQHISPIRGNDSSFQTESSRGTFSNQSSNQTSAQGDLSSSPQVANVLGSEWFTHQKRDIEKKLIAVQKLKKQRLRDEKATAAKLERTLPMDLLAFDWFNENSLTSELRVYLIDNLLPTLILGMEKVLSEAEKHGMIEEDWDKTEAKFNPVTLLAQYLMRNNPRYSNLSETSPYVRGLRKVSEELKRDVYAIGANKLARLKLEAEQKRNDLEERERKKEEDAKERARLLRIQFAQWLVDSGKLQLQLIQNALYSYLEISSHLASDVENVIHYSKELDPTDETGKTLTVEGYIEYVEQFVCEMTMPEFYQLLHHLDQCAFAFRRTFEHEVWRDMFLKLFNAIDAEACGYINRHRMLHLLEKFWDKLEDDAKNIMNNPRKWPVIELEELDDIYPDSDEDFGSDESVNVSTEEAESSEWASMPATSVETTTKQDQRSLMNGEEDGSGDQLRESAGDATSTSLEEEEKSIVTPQEDVKSQSGEKEDDVTAKPVDEDQASEKVSSAAGSDVAVAEPNIDDVPPEGKQEVKRVNFKGDVAEENEVSKGEREEEEEKEEKDAKNVTETVKDDEDQKNAKPDDGDVVKEEENNSSPIEVKDEEDTALTEQVMEEDKTEIVVNEPEVEIKVQEEKEITPREEDIGETDLNIDTKEDHKDAEGKSPVPDMTSLLGTSSKLAATLITPAPSHDANVDVSPVNIQFSKETPSSHKVRKTTTFASVELKPRVDFGKAPGQAADDELLQVATSEQQESDLAKPEQVERLEGTEKDTETVVTTTAEGSEVVHVQNTAEDMPNEYRPLPYEVKARQPSASRMSVTFASEPLILPDRPSAEFFSHYSSRSQSRMTSVFDEDQLNQNRFISLLENFISDDTTHGIVEELVNFIHGGYVETEEEKMARLEKARRELLSAKHRQMVDNLFNKWDNDGQGHVDNEEVDDILLKYKGGVEASALKRGRQAVRQLRKNAPYHDRRRLYRKEFHVYINSVCDAMVGGEEVFDGLIEYATSTVERTYAERVRGEARRKWLAQIQSSAESGGASMDPVYRAIFQTLAKDADAHGNQKKMSAYIGLLENNILHPRRGPVLLRYVACTPDNAPYMLGKAFYEDMRGITFYSVRRGKLVHVPRVQSHGRIYFWNPVRLEGDREGSLVLVPLRDPNRRTYGLIGIDNVDSAATTDRSVFVSHEINFYQGIAKTFSNAFHHVDLRRKLMRIIEAAMSWVHSRAPRVHNIVIYFVEPDPKSQVTYVLRKMMTADNNTGVTISHSRPQRLYRKDNLFRDYLFKCMENSETTSADAYGERHTAYPLRDEQGRCQCVIDISIGKLRALPRHENKEVQRMLKLLQAANREVMKESASGEKTMVLEAEERGNDDTRVDIMFDRLMLTDLRENVSKLDTNVFAELKNYKIPPTMIHNILKAVLMLFHHDPEKHEEFNDWVSCKQMVTNKLRQRILVYDPTSDEENGDTEEETELVVRSVGQLLKGIPHGAVAKHGSRPAQQLYNWAFVCLSLIEHARKMRQNDGQPAVTPVTSASTNTTVESGVDVIENF